MRSMPVISCQSTHEWSAQGTAGLGPGRLVLVRCGKDDLTLPSGSPVCVFTTNEDSTEVE